MCGKRSYAEGEAGIIGFSTHEHGVKMKLISAPRSK